MKFLVIFLAKTIEFGVTSINRAELTNFVSTILSMELNVSFVLNFLNRQEAAQKLAQTAEFFANPKIDNSAVRMKNASTINMATSAF